MQTALHFDYTCVYRLEQVNSCYTGIGFAMKELEAADRRRVADEQRLVQEREREKHRLNADISNAQSQLSREEEKRQALDKQVCVYSCRYMCVCV